MQIELIDGLWWPKGDKECRPAVIGHYKDADEAIKLCKEKNIVVQAGGNCGVWAKYLAGIFKHVYTFEPDDTNFECLERNVTEENVFKFKACLGDSNNPLGLNVVKDNIGAHYIAKEGNIPQIRIDDLHLDGCDLLQLDIEGYEYFALKGAEETIKKFSPVIMIEDKRHYKRFDVKEGQIISYLESLGYVIYTKVARDLILVKNDR